MKKNKYKIILKIVLLFFISAGPIKHSFAQKYTEQGQHFAKISGGTIWYHVIGEGDKAPLLLLHGGPGGTCHALYPLSELADKRPLIFFDQIGTGRSGTISDTSLMHIDYMVEQLKEFTDFLQLEDYYLYGHSWGTMLGLDYYLKYPNGIKGMILNSPLVSTKMWMMDADTLVSTLHDTIQEVIKLNEKNMTYNTKEYQAAIQVYSSNFIWRNNNNIDTKYDTERVSGNSKMYNYMWGPSEFNATGNLKYYDRLNRLREIKTPTLYITGEFDEARPVTVKYYSSLTPDSEFKVIPNAAHASMHDNQNDNVNMIRDFLNKLD